MMRFLVTVDTEADNQWDGRHALSTENVRFWERFQHLCERHSLRPTYLVTSEVAADRRASRLLARWLSQDAIEVGAHLHAWSTPPFADRAGLRLNDASRPYQSQMPDGMLAGKLRNLTREIEHNLGVRPRSFRAGRFGIDQRSAVILAELGYLVDSSVTPGVSWRRAPGAGGAGGPDFRHYPAAPFMVGGTGVEGGAGLLEVPVTVVPTLRALRRSPVLLSVYGLPPVRAARRLLFGRWLCPQPVWLHPFPFFSATDLCRAYDEHARTCDTAVMMVHSSELMPGGSPYRATPAAVDDLFEVLERLFAHAGRDGARGATLTEAAGSILAAGGLETRVLQT